MAREGCRFGGVLLQVTQWLLILTTLEGITAVDNDFGAVRKDILNWWDKNSSDEAFYYNHYGFREIERLLSILRGHPVRR